MSRRSTGNKVVARDDELAAKIGLTIQADRDLPDLILVDLGPADPLLLFVEVVATDGPISERRRLSLTELAANGGFDASRVACLSAYADRDAPGYRKTYRHLAWGSFAWFASEPDKLLILREGVVELDALLPLDP
ncbi:BsuBI/PstI family type II restriction endonuclease [uncultured Thiohalocapsa sp.]|uniref:BsuBI/PstI family type II restriction endonuclease n=1 Tax=uncultured Thiohalocapsa sp. TaxID=768990 RepID=UPI0025F6D0F2|nr:BsuBI/PstI family type II restriction endonuclease [uncultured Thiohalocapsa sp.]